MLASTGRPEEAPDRKQDGEANLYGWRVGAATMVFPTRTGLPMDGYVARQGTSVAVLDALTVSAFVLEQGSHRVVVVAADVIGVDEDLVEEVRQAGGIVGDVLLCASHTHSGPAGVVKRLHPADRERHEPAVRRAFVEVSVAAIRKAGASLEVAGLWFGQADAPGVAANRNTPGGPASKLVSVLEARRPDGHQIAMIVHFACHPTILGADNLGISADLISGMRAALGRPQGSGHTPVLYLNGAAGDVSTRFTRRRQDYSEVGRLGGLLAEGVIEARARVQPLLGPLATAHVEVQTILKASQPLVALEEAARRLRHEATRAQEAHAAPEIQRLAQTRAEGAELQVQLARSGGGARQFKLVAHNWGGLIVVSIPGELFATLGKAIQEQAHIHPVIVVGYANGYVGYIADEQAYADETYEALASPFAAELGHRVVDSAVRLIQRVHETADHSE